MYAASYKQIVFIASLANERGITVNTANLTSRDASALIGSLLDTPRKAPEHVASNLARPEVAAGRYALEVEGVIKFYKVDRPVAPSKWAGYTFLKVVAGPVDYPIKGASAAPILAAIAADPITALRRYGTEIGKCGHCNLTLTDATSRAYGIGPVCRERMGL